MRGISKPSKCGQMTGSLYKRGKVWWMAYMVDGHQNCQSTKTANKKIAAKILNLRVTEIIEGQYRLPKSNPPTLEKWALHFLESISHPTTKRTYKSCINILTEFFGSALISKISCELIEEFKMARRNAGAGPATINRKLAVLRRMLKVTERQRLIVRSPFADVDFLEERSMRRQATVLSFDEQKRLEAAAPPHLRTLIVLLTENCELEKKRYHLNGKTWTWCKECSTSGFRKPPQGDAWFRCRSTVQARCRSG
jgi:Phage integrase SAM-like domain